MNLGLGWFLNFFYFIFLICKMGMMMIMPAACNVYSKRMPFLYSLVIMATFIEACYVSGTVLSEVW